jgi:hypothetical protein
MSRVLKHPIKTRGGRDALYSGFVDEDGKPHGYGKFVVTTKDDREGTVDSGVFVNGSLQGLGKVALANGEMWTGEFVEGQLDGVGYYEWPDGDYFSGQFKGGKRHGFGTYRSSDGQRYIGGYSVHKRHGIAIYSFADGSRAAVTYEQGELVSQTSGQS